MMKMGGMHWTQRLIPFAAVVAVITVLFITGCQGTMPTMGGGGTVATGSAGGANAQGASSQLERCSESLGTVAVVEDQGAPWYGYLSSQYKLGSTVPVLRMLIQQSNCFVVVERGRAMSNLMQERALESSGEMRRGSKFGKGQMVAADYTMSPSITFSQKGTGGAGAALGGLIGRVGAVAAGGLRSNEASTTLLMIDNRSGVQLAAAEGSAKNFDFNLFGGMFGSGGGGAAGGYTNTPEGKILTAAFMDSYNKIVIAVRNYKAQTVKGGLGTGGRLGVQGGQTDASRELDGTSQGTVTVKSKYNSVNVRSAPGPNKPVIATIPGGSTITKISSNKDWVKVRVDKEDGSQVDGWVSKTVLE
ncbi:MAG TPA: SH3 domain-containing protein [Dissulfurispiraceae bacterium]|nr:SH3 domain-containing protein [Dissulfurispiraceae bacterium]